MDEYDPTIEGAPTFLRASRRRPDLNDILLGNQIRTENSVLSMMKWPFLMFSILLVRKNMGEPRTSRCLPGMSL